MVRVFFVNIISLFVLLFGIAGLVSFCLRHSSLDLRDEISNEEEDSRHHDISVPDPQFMPTNPNRNMTGQVCPQMLEFVLVYLQSSSDDQHPQS